MDKNIIPIERIKHTIVELRHKKVIIDTDLATIYGTTTKHLNQAVRRNLGRFPNDFMFQLTKEEKTEVVTICDHLSGLKYSPHLPYAFTEHGAVMAASVLNSQRAIQVSIFVVRAFIDLRKMAANYRDLLRKVEAMEKKYDEQFRIVFEAIKQLMQPTPPKKRKDKIGFRQGK